MKPIQEVYPELKEHEYFYGPGNYDPMISSEYEILYSVMDHDYQGDTRYLLKDGDKWGYLVVGWGSCSGCDALQACSSFEEIEELRDHIISSIKWFNSPKETLEYFETHDWKLDWSWHMKEYIDGSIKLLKEITND